MVRSSSASKRCRRDKIRDTIVSRILDGSYPPNTHLKELVLAAEFGVSQTPVREALRELEMLGLVTTKQYCGTKVQSLAWADLQEAYELRAVIEERAAQLATPCSSETLQFLADAVVRMREAAHRGDADSFATGVVSFHRLIVTESCNRLFLRTWDAQQWEVRTRVTVHLMIESGILPVVAANHDEIVETLRQGDGSRAGQLLRRLIERLLLQMASHPQFAPRTY
jgi:DNA-binding GntR family transcriptional regulator